MARAKTDRDTFEGRAKRDPYASMTQQDREHMAREMNITTVDATKQDNGIPADMTWGQSHIGGGGPLTITDYGRHRDDEGLDHDSFESLIRDKLADSIGTQYLKVMDDEKEQVADTLIAISKSNGYVVLPHFG